MSDVFFFTELDKLHTQTNSQAYGPVLGSESTEYRITSQFTLSSDALAFAVTTSMVLVQPQWDDATSAPSTSIVNIVLKPLLPLDNGGNKVAYLVYRGIKRDSILNGTSFPAETNPNNVGLVKSVWLDFRAALSTTPPITSGSSPSLNRIGAHFDQESDDMTLDEIFYKNKVISVGDGPIQLTVISGGASLGIFSSNATIGFEVILEDRFYNPTLNFARTEEHLVTAGNPGSISPGDSSLNQMRRREDILNFIDPIAFYSSFFNLGIKYRISTSTDLQSSIGFASFYQTIANKFYTKNVVYIDIRNENGYSLNYYKDYQGEDYQSDFGKHITIGYNSQPASIQSYYINYWPIFSTIITNTQNHDYTLLSLGVRNQVNIKPTLYVDYGFVYDPNKLNFVTRQGAGKFLDLGDGNTTNFSGKINFITPNFQPENKSVSILLKFIVGRIVQPELPPSGKFVTKQHALDNAFGPLEPSPDLGVTTEPNAWKSISGKRFIHSKRLGIQFVFENSIIFTNSEVAFILSLIDYRVLSYAGPVDIDNLGSLGNGKSDNTSAAIALKRAFSDVLGILYKEIEISPANSIIFPRFFLENQKEFQPKPVFGIFMTREEYDDRLWPAALLLDRSAHDIYLNISPLEFHSYSDDQVSNGQYYDAIIKVSGINSSGIYQEIAPLSGNLRVYTIDGAFISTADYGLASFSGEQTNEYAYFTDTAFIRYVKLVEELYASQDKNPNDDNHSVKRTATRIRVHSYGRQATYNLTTNPLTSGKELALEKALPDAEYKVYVATDRMLDHERFYFSDTLNNAYNHLTAKADENMFRDNPSPYLRVKQPSTGQIRQVDMGQVLYGFESLVIPDPINPTIGKGYREIKNGYPIEIAFDLTGVIANIATPVADLIFHRQNGVSPYSYDIAPNSPDINAYYAISAPLPDLLGNADAVGLSRAYINLINNPNLKLSDVLTLYYKSDSSGLHNSNLFPLHTIEHRWMILAIELGLVKKVGNKYRWLPDLSSGHPDYFYWEAVKLDLISRMYNFAEFWYNTKENVIRTTRRIVLNQDTNIDRLNSVLSHSALLGVYEDIDFILTELFLPFVKSEIQSEDPTILIP